MTKTKVPIDVTRWTCLFITSTVQKSALPDRSSSRRRTTTPTASPRDATRCQRQQRFLLRPWRRE